MIRLAEKLGLICEARIRKVRYFNGVYYDSIKYGILREEFFNFNFYILYKCTYYIYSLLCYPIIHIILQYYIEYNNNILFLKKLKYRVRILLYIF